MAERLRELVFEARRELGVRRLAFAIHDASFPGDPETDLGHGSPYGRAALALLSYVRELGFDILQLGPQGAISEGNPSPYDGAAFSRRLLSADLSLLSEQDWGRLLPREAIVAWADQRPADATRRVSYDFANRAQRTLLLSAHQALARGAVAGERALLLAAERAFRARHDRWLGRDALFECLEREHRGTPWTSWGDPDAHLLHPRAGERDAFERRRASLESKHRREIELYVFGQVVVHEQHRRAREALAQLGMKVYGDLQIGLSARDAWAWQPLLLHDYRLGAPPSRTNPEGQSWGYLPFDPTHYHNGDRPGPVLRVLSERMEKIFDEYDGLRIDHPHGLVCPWVYRADSPDPLHAVQNGARLFEAPDLPDHPELARFAIARRDQLARDPKVSRWDDHWVAWLEPDQVERYGVLFDAVVDAARRHGRRPDDLACEVLSTLPHPLACVLEGHGLGRFRVTQKLDPGDPRDPYRLERATRADWVMVGTHDTPPLWRLVDAWSSARATTRARYSAELLVPDGRQRAAFAEALVRERGLLAQALLAELFASRAENVMVFFSDLFGLETAYNEPGTISSSNWSLRLPPSWCDDHRARLRCHRALNLPLAMALALRARGARPDLQAALAEEALRLAPLPPGWVGGTR